MPCPIASLKFVGTISLGLLTGVSYSLSAITLPSLQLLPSASHASRTLRNLQIQSTRTILSLASITSLSLLTSFWMSRKKHPYLIWVSLMSFAAGQGLEGWYNGLNRFPKMFKDNYVVKKMRGGEKRRDGKATASDGSGDEWDMLAASQAEEGGVNGETVESEMARERWVQGLRTGIAGIGFAMGVVGIWGDGA